MEKTTRGKIVGFLFDSAYQAVTWVWIAISISAFFYYAGKDNERGMRWLAPFSL